MGDAGSLRKGSAKGIPFDIISDTDASEIPSKYENTLIATNNGNRLKQETRAETVEDMVIFASRQTIKTFRRIADAGEKIGLSYTESDGSVRKATGWINIDTRTTMEGRATLMLLPQGEWT